MRRLHRTQSSFCCSSFCYSLQLSSSLAAIPSANVIREVRSAAVQSAVADRVRLASESHARGAYGEAAAAVVRSPRDFNLRSDHG